MVMSYPPIELCTLCNFGNIQIGHTLVHSPLFLISQKEFKFQFDNKRWNGYFIWSRRTRECLQESEVSSYIHVVGENQTISEAISFFFKKKLQLQGEWLHLTFFFFDWLELRVPGLFGRICFMGWGVLRATSHTRLRAHDHWTSSTLIGGKGGAGPSLLHTTLEGSTE